MTKNIIAILVNYNYGPKAASVISRVVKFKSVSKALVVDNASTDNSLELLRRLNSKKLQIISKKINTGYDHAVNIGISYALKLKPKSVMLLDGDLDFQNDFIDHLDNLGADVAVPVLKFKRLKKWVYDYGGKINFALGRATHDEKPMLIKNRISLCPDFVSGGCTLIRKEVFEKIGLYDERFFLYYGDTDFSLRAKLAGFKVAVDVKNIVTHHIAEHKITQNWHKNKLALQGNFEFINKWVPSYFKPIAYSYFLILLIKVIASLFVNQLSSNNRS